MRLFVSKAGAYSLATNYVMLAGMYDAENVLLCKGYTMGNSILFDSRRYVMPVEEFNSNFEPMGGNEND